jgi:mono/diheme cytochrome c family protein
MGTRSVIRSFHAAAISMVHSLQRLSGGSMRSIGTGFVRCAVGALLLGVSGCSQNDVPVHQRISDGNPERGRLMIGKIGCGVCHEIPGIRGARGIVGPSLAKFGPRALIGGVAPNRPEQLVRWVRDAPSLAPNTAMPSLPLSEDDARHVAAYLYSLR